MVATIFEGFASNESRRERKLAARRVLAVVSEETTANPSYRSWSEVSITHMDDNGTIQHLTINPTQRLRPTGRKVIARSTIEGLNQDKSTVSCVNHRVPHTPKPEHTVLGTPVAGYRWSNIDS